MTRLVCILAWLCLLAGVAFGQAVERNPGGKPFWSKQSTVWTAGQCLITDGANQASFQTCPGGSSADIEDVGDCTSGACFTDGASNGSKLVYEGATVNGNQTTLTFTGDPGGDYTVTIPNITGTLVTTGDSGTVTGAMIADGASGVSLTADVTGTLPVANGGTNLTAATDDNVMVGNGTTWQSKALPTCTDTGGNHLNYDISTNTLSCGTSNSGTTGAPTAAQYLTLATDGTLSAERVLTPGVGIAGVDGGADSPYTISFASTELGDLTWGANTAASEVWTVATNGATDPVITFSNASVDVTTGTLKQGGTAVSLSGHTHGVTTGGTGLTTLAQGDLLYGSASNTISALAKDATATRYLANTGTSNNPAWAQVNMANGVTGTLPLGNGGTGKGTAWTANMCVRVNAAGTALETAGADCGTATGISALRDDGGSDTTGTTITVAGASGITTTAAGSLFSVNWEPAELGNVGWFTGSQASQTFTFAVTGTDPVLTFSDSSINVSTGTLKQGGTAVSVVGHTHAGSDINSGSVAIANGGTGQTSQTAAFDALAPTTTKGDLIAHNGTDNVRVGVGTNGQILVADSTAAAGVKWAASSAGLTGSGVDNDVARWDGTGALQGSDWQITDAGVLQTSTTSVLTSGAIQALASGLNVQPSGSSTAVFTGLYGAAIHGNGNAIAAGGALVGVDGLAWKGSTGAVDTAIGVRAQVQNTDATGAIANGYAIYLPASVTTGAITNNYGLYQAGTEANSLGGDLALRAGLLTGAKTTTATGTTTGVTYTLTGNASSGTPLYRGASISATTSAGSVIDADVTGLVGSGLCTTTTNRCDTVIGVSGTAAKTFSGPTTTAYGVVGQVLNAYATAAIGTGAAFYAAPPTLTGAITDYAAILIPDQGGGYGIHQTGDETNLLSGALQVYNDTTITGGDLGITGGVISQSVTTTDTSNPAAVAITGAVTANPASASAQNIIGESITVASGVLVSSNLTGTLTGADISSTHYGTGTSTATAVVGINAYVGKQSSGPVTTLTAIKAKVGNAVASNAVGTAYGIYLDTPDTTGTISTLYGLYQAGTTDRNYLGAPLGLGTTTVPKGGVGLAKLAIEGTDSNVAGPNIQLTTSANNYPLVQIASWTHDNINFAWDAHLNSAWSAWVSSDAGSNYLLDKGDTLADAFTLSGHWGTAAGSDIGLTSVWTPIWRATSTELIVNDSGASRDFRVEGDTDANALMVDGSADAVGIGTATPASKLHVKSATAESRVKIESAGTNTDAVLELITANEAWRLWVDESASQTFKIDSDTAGTVLQVTPDGQISGATTITAEGTATGLAYTLTGNVTSGTGVDRAGDFAAIAATYADAMNTQLGVLGTGQCGSVNGCVSVTGVQALGRHTQSSTVGTAYGIYSEIINGSGTMTSAYGVYVAAPTNNGTIGNLWGFYQAGTEPSRFGGPVVFADPGTRPTCDSSQRGKLWLDAGAGGVADTFAICGKDASDTYGWRALY